MAYAAIISLKHNIEHLILIDPTINPEITRDAYTILCNLGVMIQKLDNKTNPRFDVDAIKAVDAKIRKVVWKVEDVLEYYALRHSLPASANPQLQMQMQIPVVDNKGVEQVIQSFIKTVEILGLELDTLQSNPLEEEEEEDVSPKPEFGGNKQSTAIVLFNDDTEEIIKWFLYEESSFFPKSITLVGMAGIGKTHFARDIYQHPLIDQSFDVKAWAGVGQNCRSVKKILVQIVAQIERQPRNVYVDKDVETLSALLKTSLNGRRCLVVLDDIWSKALCKDIIDRLRAAGVEKTILTTRIRNVNDSWGNNICDMPFWDNEKSWYLLWRSVFRDESSFPPQLEKAGKKIAENCESLPLLILAVADILSGEDKTEEYWNKVSNKKTSTFMDAYEKISGILSSSYEYLPQHLKACFLYMGVFPQTCEIPLRKLNNLLIAEDFLEPNESNKPLDEGFIFDCVWKLVEDSVVISCKKSMYEMSSCKLHSAYWYLCVKEARKNKFLHALNKLTDGYEYYIESQRRLSIHNNMLFGIKEVRDSMAVASTTRSLLFTGEDHQYPVSIFYNLMLLRVLDAFAIRLYEFPEEVVKLMLLRYLSLTHYGKLPRSMSNLRRLQCLIIRQHHNIKLLRDSHSTFLPEQIWDMQQLKHLRIMQYNLPDPSNGVELPNLKTLYVNAHSCTEAVFRSLPNLKKLGIAIELHPEEAVESSWSFFEHIELLKKLKSFKCVVVNPWLMRSDDDLSPFYYLSHLPWDLEKLSMNGLGYSWDSMTPIASLVYLKVLKLRCSAFQGTKWMIVLENFRSLQFLLLEDIDIVRLGTAFFDGFQHLVHLTFRHNKINIISII